MKSGKGKTLNKRSQKAFKEEAYKLLQDIPNKKVWLMVRQRFMEDTTVSKECHDIAMDLLDQVAKERGWDIEIALDNALDRIFGRK